jgi:hypothetical protein
MESNTPNEIQTIATDHRVAILVDGNNIGMGLHEKMNDRGAMLNFKTVVPRILKGRTLKKMFYFREGDSISPKLGKMLHDEFLGSVITCGKSADVQVAVTAIEISEKVDTIIILSGDGDYLPLVRHLKSRGVSVEVASVRKNASRKLLMEVDCFWEITESDVWTYKPKTNSVIKTASVENPIQKTEESK